MGTVSVNRKLSGQEFHEKNISLKLFFSKVGQFRVERQRHPTVNNDRDRLKHQRYFYFITNHVTPVPKIGHGVAKPQPEIAEPNVEVKRGLRRRA
jgi:hypothetical protein